MNDESNQAQEGRNMSLSRKIVTVYAVAGIVWITAMIILAYLGRGDTAIELLKNVRPIIYIPLICYFPTKTIENIFKYNNIFQFRRATSEETAAPGEADIPG